MASPETVAAAPPPDAPPPGATRAPGAQLLAEPIVQIGLIAAGTFLFVREIRDLRARDRELSHAAAQRSLRRKEMLALSSRVLLGSLVMVLFGLALLAGHAGLVPVDVAMNLFGIAMIPASAALLFTLIWGVPETVARWIFGS